jgi:hypothetical protein
VSPDWMRGGCVIVVPSQCYIDRPARRGFVARGSGAVRVFQRHIILTAKGGDDPFSW